MCRPRTRDLRIEERPYDDPGAGEIAVTVALGGIRKSDLHYYRHGRVGDFAVREPMVLGHEIVGPVAALGPDTSGPAVALRWPSIRPPRATGAPSAPRAGATSAHTRYLGSAARTPHVQGGFARTVTAPAARIRVLPPGLALDRAVLAEPLSVTLHAVRRAGGVGASGCW
ncbi:alcohol dehydrogenase catalytic domain-containing protein [Streptomyces sp. CA-249302]|uniref:alcohol dehydrogenase catalytic domain-containing protein n=1 Tax=Streptomyces sp. CA-249302 TaxID=3240058 RepID=UPI003D8B6BD4